MGGMFKGLRKVWTDQGGISSVEYAMLLALVGAGISVATGLLGDSVADRISGSSEVFDPVAGGEPDAGDIGDAISGPNNDPGGTPGNNAGGGGDDGCHNQGGGDGIGQGKGKGGDNTC